MEEYDEAGAANWLYDVCELYEDEDLDPENASEVIKRAFMSSNCDDFAWLLSEITGWQTVRMTFNTDWGFGHHSLVKSPEGKLLDVRGWTDETKTKRYFKLKDDTQVTLQEAPITGADWTNTSDDSFSVMLAALKSRKAAPFNTKDFKEKVENYEASIRTTMQP